MFPENKIPYEVHKIPSEKQMQDIHRNYGLWIIRYHSGGGKINSFYSCRERYFQYYAVSHMHSGCGKLWFKETGITQDVHPGDCIMVTPGTVNRYGGCNDERFVEDSVNFCGPVADMLMRSGIISNGIFPGGKIRKLRLIIDYFLDPAVDSQIRANIELQKFLVDLYFNKMNRKNLSYPLLDELIQAIKENPQKWWRVEDMAEMCNMSIDQMRRVFFQRTGLTPKMYVDKIKLTSAAEMLLQNTCTISEAALHFGYKDPYHFSRRFKAVMGISPSQYRKI